jgi:hypothetical protein
MSKAIESQRDTSTTSRKGRKPINGRMDGMRADELTCSHSCRTATYRMRHRRPIDVAESPIGRVERNCSNCGCVLTGKQRLFCSDRCRKQYERDLVRAIVANEDTP